MTSQESRMVRAIAYYVPSVLVMLGLLLAWQLAVDIGSVTRSRLGIKGS